MRQEDYKMVQGVNQVVQMSPQVAASYGSSVARLGQTLAQTGQDITRLMEETQQAQDQTTLLKAKSRWEDKKVELNNFMRENKNDPEKWQEKRANIISELEAYNHTLIGSRNFKNALTNEWMGWSGSMSRGVDSSMHQQIFKNRVGVSLQLRDKYMENGQFDQARAVVQGLEGSLDADVYFAAQEGINKKEKNFYLNEDLATDAYLLKSNLSAGKYDIKTEQERKQWMDKADAEIRREEARTSEDVMDAILVGDITTPDEVRKRFHEDASETTIDKLSTYLKEHKNDEFQQYIALPETQRSIIADVTTRIADYDPDSITLDEEKYQINRLIRQVTDEDRKEELKKYLERVESRDEELLSFTDKAVNRAVQSGDFPKPVLEREKVSFTTYIRDKNLSRAKLAEMTNLDEDDVNYINKLIENGQHREAVALYGIKMRKLGSNAFKKKDLTRWEQDFYVALAQDPPPSLSKTAHEKAPSPRQLVEYELNKKVRDRRVSLIRSDMEAWIGNRRADEISPEEVDTFFRKFKLHHSEKKVRAMLEEEKKKKIKDDRLSVNHTPEGFRPPEAQREKDWANGKFYISLDSNKADGVESTQPLVVIPDNSPQELVDAANRYVALMNDLHTNEFGRNYKTRVVTKSQNKRGEPYVTHLEGFAITDKQMVSFLKTKRGRAVYRSILDESFSGLAGATLGLPHSAKDTGAKDDQTLDNEVSLARFILESHDNRLASN